MEKKFSLSDVMVLKSEDLLNEEGLSKIIGGAVVLAGQSSLEPGECACKCQKGNCHED